MKRTRCIAALIFIFVSPAVSGLLDRYASNRDVEKWISKWQKKLDLPGWKIAGRVAKASEMRADVLGQSDWNVDTKTATVLVLAGDEYDRYSNDVYYDQELTVVHELVHIRLSAVSPRAEKDVEESFVVAMSEAIFGRRAKR